MKRSLNIAQKPQNYNKIRQKCIGGWGSAPDPAGELITLPGPLAIKAGALPQTPLGELPALPQTPGPTLL